MNKTSSKIRKGQQKFEINGVDYQTYAQAARDFDIDPKLVQSRIKAQGWTIEEALNLVPRRKQNKIGGSIYCIYNIVNTKIYIGLTQHAKIKTRFSEHKRAINSQPNNKLYKAMLEIGVNKFKIKKICSCGSNEELRNKEKFYIKKYNSIEKGYNSSIGGQIHYSLTNPIIFKGKSYETRQHLADYLGIPLGTLSSRLFKGTPLDKPYDDNGFAQPIKIGKRKFKSITQAAKFLGLSVATISNRLKCGKSLDTSPIDTSMPIIIDGIKYSSLTKAAKNLNTTIYMIKKLYCNDNLILS